MTQPMSPWRLFNYYSAPSIGEHQIDHKRRPGGGLSRCDKLGQSPPRKEILHSPMMRIAAMFLFASTVSALCTDLIGQASVIDGDTLEIHATRIRLWASPALPWRGQLAISVRAKAANELAAGPITSSALAEHSLFGQPRFPKTLNHQVRV